MSSSKDWKKVNDCRGRNKYDLLIKKMKGRGIMKAWGIRCLFIIGMFGALRAGAAEKKISQDDVRLDLSSGEFRFNDEVVDAEQLAERVRESYAVSVRVGDFSDHGADDLFGEAPVRKSALPKWFSAQRLIDALEPIEAAGIDPKLVRLNIFISGGERPSGGLLVIGPDEELLLNRKPISLAELSGEERGVVILGMKREYSEHWLDYRRVLEVARALGSDIKISALHCDDRLQVEVSAMIYTLKDDGTKHVLTAPKLTTKAGNSALLRVVTNKSGMKTFESDEFHQEDLGNLGVRLSVEPRIIGDYITLSDVVILTKAKGIEEVFRTDDIPVYSYSATKMVAPFSARFPPGENSVEFKIADINGEPAMCRLSAEVVDDRGMTRADHDKARASAN